MAWPVLVRPDGYAMGRQLGLHPEPLLDTLEAKGLFAMNDDDLDRCYSALCESIAAVGEGQAQLFLSMVCLSLMARYERADDVLALIGNVQAQCAAEVVHDL
jgi:hypothetical protein